MPNPHTPSPALILSGIRAAEMALSSTGCAIFDFSVFHPLCPSTAVVVDYLNVSLLQHPYDPFVWSLVDTDRITDRSLGSFIMPSQARSLADAVWLVLA